MRIGVDIGGTFTDLVLADDVGEETQVFKLLTTHKDPSQAVEAGIETLLTRLGLSPGDIREVVHGTTLVTNAVIARQGARSALLVTRGFRDVLEIGTEDRYDMYDLGIEKPPPVISREHVLEITERTLADGRVKTPVDVSELEEVCRILEDGAYESAAICFLHSYRNPENEEQVRSFLVERLPTLAVTHSYGISPAIREYARATTTSVNAYVMPVVRDYLQSITARLRAIKVDCQLWLMLSNGGICTIDTARAHPVRLIESGPAAGALAATQILSASGFSDGMSFDMGGTTAKVCLISGGEPGFANEIEVAREYRFKHGSGLPLQVRSVELLETGAGGGSIASIDALRLVQVGPESAQSDPGPACYGRGGARATVTDADLVLGFLNPEYFLGGEMKLDPDAAGEAIMRDVGDLLGLDLLEAAEAIHQVVNENMAGAARVHAIEQGRDPSSLPLFTFGGAGPVHACGVARILGSPSIVVPPDAGVSSAYGLLWAPLAFDFVRSAPMQLDEIDWTVVNAFFTEMEDEGRALLKRAGLTESELDLRRLCDVRFVGQGSELEVSVRNGSLGDADAGEIRGAFLEKYLQLYKHAPESVGLEILSWRAILSGPKRKPSLGKEAAAGLEKVKPDRNVCWGRRFGVLPTRVLNRYALEPGDTFDGPVIIEERESTTVLDPGTRLSVDKHLNLVASFK